MTAPLLAVDDLRVWFDRGRQVVRAVDGLSYELWPGRALAIVGESGSGKTVGARALLGLLPAGATVRSGSAVLDGHGDLLAMAPAALRRVRGRDVAMVFQNAMEAMNPTLTIERQLTEHLLWHRICDRAEAKERAIETLASVSIPEPRRRLAMYPFQLSGGTRQRAMIAMAMASRPRLLIADEPTTAVDVTVQRQIIDLLLTLKDGGTSLVMITHDLGVARALCDDVLVMYAGRKMEHGRVDEVVLDPLHPYTRGLVASSVEVGAAGRPLHPIPGNPPDLAHVPEGCPFRTRCGEAEASCAEEQQPRDLRPGRAVACWKAGAHVG